MTIPAYDYELDNEYREKHKKYFNIDQYSRNHRVYTLYEQIERHAQNLYFWFNELKDVRDDIRRNIFICVNLHGIYNRIKNKYTQITYDRITNRLKELSQGKIDLTDLFAKYIFYNSQWSY